MNRKTLRAAAVLFTLSVLVFTACSGGGGSGSSGKKIRLSGTLGNSYISASAKPQSFFAKWFPFFASDVYAMRDGYTVNKVVAVPIHEGSVDASRMNLSVSAPIDSTKTFSLSLDRSGDWMLVFLNTNMTDTTSRFVGYVDLSSGATGSLLLLPSTGATIDAHDLGTIDTRGDTASVTNPIAATDFSLTADQLNLLAKSSNIFRYAKNAVLNYDPVSGIYYNLRPNYLFRGDYYGSINPFQATLPAETYMPAGYTLQLDSNVPKTALSMDMVTGLTSTNLPTPPTAFELFPPQPVRTGIASYGTTTPFTNITSGMTCTFKTENNTPIRYCTDDDMSITDYANISYWIGMNNPIQGDAVPAGWWNLKVGGVTKAQFDVAAAKPVNANNVILTPIPVFKTNLSDSDTIDSIEVKWYVPNDAGDGYVQLADTSILNKLLTNCDYAIEGNDPSGESLFLRENEIFNPMTQTTIVPQQRWYFNVGEGLQFVKSMQLHCDSGGVGFFFQYPVGVPAAKEPPLALMPRPAMID